MAAQGVAGGYRDQWLETTARVGASPRDRIAVVLGPRSSAPSGGGAGGLGNGREVPRVTVVVPHEPVAVASPSADASQTITYSHSPGLFARLARLDIALAFTSYQSGFLYMLGSTPDQGPQLHQSAAAKPMGLAVGPDGGLVVASSATVVRYRDVLRPGERVDHLFDACFMPRTIHVTGELDAHDLAIDADGRVVFVNTRFNCLATLSDTHSFDALWRPPFISALVDEDRCHLNGLAMEDGRPAYVTAVSRSDTVDGWRDRRASGGVMIDMRTDEVVCAGLSMPHSPRLHRGELWLLNAGTGELGIAPRDGGPFQPRVFCPGFTRGLAFHGDLAFVGLSKPRYHRFDGLPLARRLDDADSEPWCGIQVIDLAKRQCVDWFRIDGAVDELYDLAVIAGRTCPMAVSPSAPDASTLITFTDRTAPWEAACDQSHATRPQSSAAGRVVPGLCGACALWPRDRRHLHRGGRAHGLRAAGEPRDRHDPDDHDAQRRHHARLRHRHLADRRQRDRADRRRDHLYRHQRVVNHRCGQRHHCAQRHGRPDGDDQWSDHRQWRYRHLFVQRERRDGRIDRERQHRDGRQQRGGRRAARRGRDLDHHQRAGDLQWGPRWCDLRTGQ